MREAVIRCSQCTCHAAETAKTGFVQLAPALMVKRAAYRPYALPLKSQLTTGSTDCARRGFLLQLTCSLPDGSQALGVGEVAPLAGLLSALPFRILRSSASLMLAILLNEPRWISHIAWLCAHCACIRSGPATLIQHPAPCTIPLTSLRDCYCRTAQGESARSRGAACHVGGAAPGRCCTCLSGIAAGTSPENSSADAYEVKYYMP